jgi:metal-sulfur cluster biosynthetic enzyme
LVDYLNDLLIPQSELTRQCRHADITMTLTYSGCPAKDIIIGDIKRAVYGVDGVEEITVDTVYHPTWDYDRITERGRKELNEYGIAIPGYEEAPDPDCH